MRIIAVVLPLPQARDAERLAAMYKGARREPPAEPDPLEELARLVGEREPPSPKVLTFPRRRRSR